MAPVKKFNENLHLLSKKQLESEIDIVKGQLKASEEQLKELEKILEESYQTRRDMREGRKSYDSDVDSAEEKKIDQMSQELDLKIKEVAGHKENLECREKALREKRE